MRIDFDYLKFKNLGTFGNNDNFINFNKGINLITAPNGSGKSLIIEAFVFCLTGKPYRKLKKIKNIINRTNKKGLYTEIGFHINNNYWKIVRTLEPNDLSYYYKNNDTGEYDKIDPLSSKSLDQVEISKLLKINAFMIKQIVALDVSYNDPFLSLTAAESREILENIFNLSVISRMLVDIKTKLANLESDLLLETKSIGYLDNNIKNQEDNITKLTDLQNNFLEIKTNNITKYSEQITELENKIILHKENISIGENYLNTNLTKDTLEILTSLKSLESKVFENRQQIKINLQRINLLNLGKCPTCSHKFKEVSSKDEIDTLQKDNKNLEKQIITTNENIANLEKQVNSINEFNNDIKETKNAIKYENEQIESLKKHIINYNNLITEENNKKIDFNIKDLNKTLKETKNSKIIKDNKIVTLTKDINNLKLSKEILGDKQAKAYLMNKYIPLLNSKVKEYLEKFDFNINVIFNELMEIKIIDPKMPDVTIEYESFSKGEKKRIDIALLLAFIKITKEISNWHCNIMFIDELLDGGLDDEGLDKVGNALKTMVNEDVLCIYTISQRKMSYNLFNSYISVVKDKYGFSNIESN